jgi:hypothetical protein
MGVSGNGTANGTRIYQYTCSSSAAGHVWQFVPVSAGLYQLRNPNSGKCATASGTANVSLYSIQPCTGSSFQTFTLDPFSAGYEQLLNPSSGRCLDVRGRSTADGAEFELYECDFLAPAYNQAFRFEAP